MKVPKVFQEMMLLLAVPAQVLQNIFWHTIAAVRNPGFYLYLLTQTAAYQWLSRRWTQFTTWFAQTWIGKQCINLMNWLENHILPILKPIWEHVIKPIIEFGEAYKSTLTVMLLATTLLSSIAVPPLAFVAIPFVIGIVAAFFERRHNIANKKLAKEQADKLKALEMQEKAQDVAIQQLTQDVSALKRLPPLQAPVRTDAPLVESALDNTRSITDQFEPPVQSPD